MPLVLDDDDSADAWRADSYTCDELVLHGWCAHGHPWVNLIDVVQTQVRCQAGCDVCGGVDTFGIVDTFGTFGDGDSSGSGSGFTADSAADSINENCGDLAQSVGQPIFYCIT